MHHHCPSVIITIRIHTHTRSCRLVKLFSEAAEHRHLLHQDHQKGESVVQSLETDTCQPSYNGTDFPCLSSAEDSTPQHLCQGISHRGHCPFIPPGKELQETGRTSVPKCVQNVFVYLWGFAQHFRDVHADFSWQAQHCRRVALFFLQVVFNLNCGIKWGQKCERRGRCSPS